MSFLNSFPRFFDGFPTFAFGFLLSAMSFYFPQCFSAFRKGFLIFLKGLPIFLDCFPLSKKSEKIYLRRQVYERLLFELRNSSPLCSPSFIVVTYIARYFDNEKELCNMTNIDFVQLSQLFQLDIEFLHGGMLPIFNALVYLTFHHNNL